MPTLLDALGRQYDPQHVQGESLFQDRFRRKYIFLYGNEDTSSSIGEDLVKLQVSFRDGSCWAYDLQTDPGERKRLGCGPYRVQYDSLLQPDTWLTATGAKFFLGIVFSLVFFLACLSSLTVADRVSRRQELLGADEFILQMCIRDRLTVEENLAVGAYRRSDNEIDDDVARWFDTFPRLAERRQQTAGSMSGGEQQMLAIARAMMSRPRLILLDEPSLGLAPLITKEVFERLSACLLYTSRCV